ncbi:MAG: peptidase M23, partial [Pseudomonadota bacterium]|nr:peptidase M23 [Pseudomonadota bacterium]
MIKRLGMILGCWLVAVLPVMAQVDPVSTARRAAQQLDRAGIALQDAEGARDRVAALTQTVQAYEEGLIALREGLRRAAIREQVLVRELDLKRERIMQMVGVLGSIQGSPETFLLLHPSGPLGTVRSGMMLGDVTPALQAEASQIAATLSEVTVLRQLQEDAKDTLLTGLTGAQAARTALSQAISDRTDLPERYAADPEKLLELLESTDTLEGFASGLSGLTDQDVLPPASRFEDLKGQLPWPVQGTLLRAMNEADAAGVARPGWLIATGPQALVTTPTAATVRYAGPLLDFGQVMIIEPAGDTLVVLGGLDQIFAEAGEVLSAGAPLGLMGGQADQTNAFLSAAAQGTGAERPETLYMEIR